MPDTLWKDPHRTMQVFLIWNDVEDGFLYPQKNLLLFFPTVQLLLISALICLLSHWLFANLSHSWHLRATLTNASIVRRTCPSVRPHADFHFLSSGFSGPWYPYSETFLHCFEILGLIFEEHLLHKHYLRFNWESCLISLGTFIIASAPFFTSLVLHFLFVYYIYVGST